jgi:hypothetical protein
MTKRKKQQGVCSNCGISFKLYAAQQAAIEKKTILEERKVDDDYSSLNLRDKILIESAIWFNFGKGILCKCTNDSREVIHKYKIDEYAIRGLKLAGLGIGAFAAIILYAEISRRFFGSPSDKDNAAVSIKNEVPDSVCRQNLRCWGDRHNIAASFACAPHIERLAEYSYKWTDGMLDIKFGHFRWSNQQAGIITYTGDKVQFQNGFGAWQNYSYQCDYDPESKSVIDVRTWPSGG